MRWLGPFTMNRIPSSAQNFPMTSFSHDAGRSRRRT